MCLAAFIEKASRRLAGGGPSGRLPRMDPIVASHAQLLPVNTELVKRAVGGLSPDELRARPGEGSNPMLWIVGHMAATRYVLLTWFGASVAGPAWAPQFARGSAVDITGAYPAIEELLAALESSGALLRETAATMTPEQWAAPSPRTFPIADPSLKGTFAFMVFHEAYHVGQLAYLRKWLGHSALVG